MKKTSWLLLLALSPAAVDHALSQSKVEDSARDAAYACPRPAPADLVKRAAELYPSKHDKNKLACAADLFFDAAQAMPADPALAVQALLVTADYIDHVNTLADFDLYGIHQGEWSARLEHAVAQGRVLDARLAASGVKEPTLLAARALFTLSANAKTADAKTQMAGSRDAMGLLGEATAADPAMLNGAALLTLARLYFDLPEFAGGDADKAAELLEQALKVAPGNPSVLRYAAYVRAQGHDPSGAAKLLTALAEVKVGPEDQQLLADEWRNGRDLAIRLQQEPLWQTLEARRQALLKQHPELLTRASVAANMHGGVDPLTGKPY